ncbi:MAG: TonB-dependent receptor [Rhodanobacter sp.]
MLRILPHHRLAVALSTALLASVTCGVANAQAQEQPATDKVTTNLQAIEVTGTRIKGADMATQVPVITITSKDIEATGLGSIGDVIQRLSISGSSLNTKFNSAGNFGFAADGSGVGSGSSTISLRNLNAKRTLILVDGLRWVNESSASGVSAAVDLNTIPSSIVERIEILKDGASSLYGSDAIAGVINIITKKKQNGVDIGLYSANYQIGDGQTDSAHVSMGAHTDRADLFFDISHFKQNGISASDWAQSSFPTPGAGLSGGSSYVPYTRTMFYPTNPGNTYGGLCPLDANGAARCNIAANGTVTGGPQAFPSGFHRFTDADRYNFAPSNLLLTPNERTGIFAQGTYAVTDTIKFYARGLYNTRKSVNQAAPEPIGLGSALYTSDLGLTTGVDATNPYNPFGVTLDPNSNFLGLGRRPIEGGPRIFQQDVDTRYIATGLQGFFSVGERDFNWDVNYVDSTNNASQTVHGTYNIAHIARALGPIANCTDSCVPLNIFGGPGSITPEMLQYIGFIERDSSSNKLRTFSTNLSGDAFNLPAGPLAFATGFEHRRLQGSYTPDSIVIAGESNGVPSLPTSGKYSINEVYVELNAPLLKDTVLAKSLDLSVASRYSDYSTFGTTTNSKVGLRWQLNDDLTLRSTWAQGFRAPSIGELFGSPARFDASITDPCNGATGTLAANCVAQGVANPATFAASNPQISTRTGGNLRLQPETSRSVTAGAVYSPSWATNTPWSQKVDFEVTYFNIKVDDSIQAPDAQTQLNRCATTNSPVFCTGIKRGLSGDIINFSNFLQNLGTVKTSGYDFSASWTGQKTSVGTFGLGASTTYTSNYSSIAKDSGLAEPLRVGLETNNQAIPKWRTTVNGTWAYAAWSASWTLRYVSSLTEQCNADLTSVGAVCSDPLADLSGGTNYLGATAYNDARVTWKIPTSFDFSVSAGINNIFDRDPPVCVSCSLNGFDPGTYDLPGRFGYVSLNVKF